MNLLKNKIDFIKQKSEEFKLYDILDYLKATESNLDSGYIDIAVIGRFKSGKSSLINSIIGREVLPCGVIPLTAVAVSIYHGKESVRVFFENGNIKKVGISDLEDYVSQEKNPNNLKSVLRVEISIPLDEKLRFFRFIDTPGLDYSDIHNRLTERLFHSLECVVFCISYDMPLSETELRIVDSLKKFAPEIIFVLTKVDLISKNDLEKLISFLKDRLKNKSVYPFSKNNPNLVENFKNDVLYKYFDNYFSAKNTIIKKRYEILEKTFIGYLNGMLKVLEEDFQKRKEFSIFFENEKNRLKDFEKNIMEIKKKIKTDNSTKIMNRFLNYQNDLYVSACSLLENDLIANSKNLGRLVINYERVIKLFLENSIYEIFNKEQSFILDIAYGSVSQMVKIANDFLNTTVSKMRETTGLYVPILEFEMIKLDISWSKRIFVKAFDIHIDFLLPFLPLSLVKIFLLKKLKSDLSFDVEKTLIRASMDVCDSINEKIDLLVANIINDIRNKFNTIERVISSEPKNKDYIKGIISKLT